MGVKGLWTLLSCCGRRIKLESLTARVLAIDVSLWLVQFLKAMRLEDGQVRQDAHIIGMFRRICRLLMFGVRPVFVFDGPAPMLKRRTLASRRRLRDISEGRLERTAEKILLSQLKLKTINELKSNLESNVASVDLDQVQLLSEPTKDEFDELFGSEMEEEESESEEIDDIAIPEGIDIMDPATLAVLPYSMQFEILERMREERAHQSRVVHMASADTPSGFSTVQLNQFLQTSAFNQKVNEIRSSLGDSSSQFIVSNPDRSYFFHKEPRSSTKRKRFQIEDIEKTSTEITLDEFQMAQWSCKSCDQENLAIRKSCQKCGHRRDCEITTWICATCAALNRNTERHCISCAQPMNRKARSSSPAIIDRSAEIDAFFEDEEEVVSIHSVTSQDRAACSDFAIEGSSVVPEPSDSRDYFAVNTHTISFSEASSDDLLHMPNSRLNFYRLQRNSSLTSGDAAIACRSAPEASARVSSVLSDSGSIEAAALSSSPSTQNIMSPSPTSSPVQDSLLISTLTPVNDVAKYCDLPDESLVASSGEVVSASFPPKSVSSPDLVDILVLSDIPSKLPASSPSAALPPSTVPVPQFLPSLSAPVSILSYPPPIVVVPSAEDSPRLHLHDSDVSHRDTVPELAAVSISTPVISPLVPLFSNSSDRLDSIPVHSVEDLNQLENQIMEDIEQMKSSQSRFMRDSDHVTNDMVEEVQILLRLFGIPFIVAPAEAEAQCAVLESLGLVDGVVSDDSDVFLFGAREVYKNMFANQRLVERYRVQDIEKEIGVNRERLIDMALLLGSDYTEGVHGIGIVNAIEIVNAFSDLTEFRDWVYSDKNEDAECVAEDDPANDRLVRLNQFKVAHRNIRRNWQVSRQFPDDAIKAAYLNPLADHAKEAFSWSKPDMLNLRIFCQDKMGWTHQHTDRLMTPVLKRLQDPLYQTKLEAFFGKGETAATIRVRGSGKLYNMACHVCRDFEMRLFLVCGDSFFSSRCRRQMNPLHIACNRIMLSFWFRLSSAHFNAMGGKFHSAGRGVLASNASILTGLT